MALPIRHVSALADVSPTIPLGTYGLLGRDGAGESPLLRPLATLRTPDTGAIKLGEGLGALAVVRQADRVRQTTGCLPQAFGVHPRASAGARR